MTRAIGILAGAVGLLTLGLAHAIAQEREGRTPQTDRMVNVSRGARLSVVNDTGEVIIRSWNRDALRIRASHDERVEIDVQSSASLVAVRSRPSGRRASVDYEITAPSWLPVRISGQFVYVGIEGAENEVSAETVRGDIAIKGGSGSVTAKTIHGEIIVEDAKGRITLNSVNEGIRVTGGTGEVTAETTNGDITLSRVQAKAVDLATVNGDLRYEGPLTSGGRYRFATHNGDITLVIPEDAGATFTVRTYNGEFQTSLPAKTVGEIRRGRRATYVLGDGGAEVDLESFGGTIRVRKPGATGPAPERARGKRGTRSR
jgi:DUF4097 and DUF4098 domain-containing protein YvlB